MTRLAAILAPAALIAGAIAALPAAAAAQSACPPPGQDRESLTELRAAGFAVTGAEAETLAMGLLGCLGDPDPALRDQIAYEGLATLMRAGALEPSAVREIGADLIERLADPADEAGFAKPFAALVLAEVARVDRVEPFLSATERETLVEAAAAYLESVADYRGYDAEEGWRHGVAHGADVLMQLSLNPALTRDQAMRILQAVAAQAAPETAHFYVYGEPGRLARPVLFIADRGLFTEAEWAAWFERLADPAPFESWDETWTSQEGLARQHNTGALVRSLYVSADASGDGPVKDLLPGALSVLQVLP